MYRLVFLFFFLNSKTFIRKLTYVTYRAAVNTAGPGPNTASVWDSLTTANTVTVTRVINSGSDQDFAFRDDKDGCGWGQERREAAEKWICSKLFCDCVDKFQSICFEFETYLLQCFEDLCNVILCHNK